MGAVTSAALGPPTAIGMVRAVFEAVCLLLGPPSAAGAAVVDTSGPRSEAAILVHRELDGGLTAPASPTPLVGACHIPAAT